MVSERAVLITYVLEFCIFAEARVVTSTGADILSVLPTFCNAT